MMILVIDVNKGVQAQTVECLGRFYRCRCYRLLITVSKTYKKVIGEIIGVDIIFVLNKIDQIPEALREKKLAQIEKQIQTKIIPNFGFKSTQIVTASAINGDLDRVLNAFEKLSPTPDRTQLENEAFLMSIDHCFQIKVKNNWFSFFTAKILGFRDRFHWDRLIWQCFNKRPSRTCKAQRSEKSKNYSNIPPESKSGKEGFT